MAGFPLNQNDLKEWSEISSHDPATSGSLMLFDFAKNYAHPEGFSLSAPKRQHVWLAGFDSQQAVFLRSCLFGVGCKYQLRFRPKKNDNDEIAWVIDSSGDHLHDTLSEHRLREIAFKYGVEKGMTAGKAIVQIQRDLPLVVLPPDFAKTIENIRSNESKTGKVDGRVVGILKAFLLSLAVIPIGIFAGFNAVVEPSPLLTFMCSGLDTIVAGLIRTFTMPLQIVIDGTYNVNRQNLVLMAVGLCGLRVLKSGIVNQVVPMFFCLARVEEYTSWKALFDAMIDHYSRHFQIDLRARVGSVFRDCSAGAQRAIEECLGEDTNVFRDLEHVKRNIKDWVSRKGREGLLDINLKESIIAKIALSAAFLPFEFAAFWTEQFRKLEAFGEIVFVDYLKTHIFYFEDGLLSASWRCGPLTCTPGFFVYLNNTIERQWRSIKNILPPYRRQDVTDLMKEIGAMFHSNVGAGKYTGLTDDLRLQPQYNMIYGPGAWPTTEEIGDPDVLRTRRLTARDMWSAIQLHGVDAILLRHRWEPAFQWTPFGEGQNV